MTSPDWSKFRTRKKPRKEPPRVPEPVRVLSPAERAALLADRPDLPPFGSRARGGGCER